MYYASQIQSCVSFRLQSKVKAITMDVRNIAYNIGTNVSLFWRFLNQTPTDIVLGAIAGW